MKAMLPAIEPFCEMLSTADTPADLFAILEKELGQVGFSRYAYRGVNFGGERVAPYYASNYPADWLQHYLEHKYVAVDPVFIESSTKVVPFCWGPKQQVGPRTPAQREFFDEAATVGIRNGVTVPVHGVAGEFATLTVVSPEDGESFTRLFSEYGNWLHLIALHFHNALRQRLRDGTATERVHLTPRELQCLKWTAAGKTAWEISVILGISDGTVVFHLKNVIKKFGVNNKQHAVVAAIMQDLIQP